MILKNETFYLNIVCSIFDQTYWFQSCK